MSIKYGRTYPPTTRKLAPAFLVGVRQRGKEKNPLVQGGKKIPLERGRKCLLRNVECCDGHFDKSRGKKMSEEAICQESYCGSKWTIPTQEDIDQSRASPDPKRREKKIIPLLPLQRKLCGRKG